MVLHHMTSQTTVALDSLGKFLEETEPVVEHLSYNDHSMESFMKLMKVFNKVCVIMCHQMSDDDPVIHEYNFINQ